MEEQEIDFSDVDEKVKELEEEPRYREDPPVPPDKKRRYFISLVFLPGDGSPRLIPMDYRITKQSYYDLWFLLSESEPAPLRIDQIVYEIIMKNGEVRRECANIYGNARIFSFNVYYIDLSRSLSLPDEMDRTLDQSKPDGDIGNKQGSAKVKVFN